MYRRNGKTQDKEELQQAGLLIIYFNFQLMNKGAENLIHLSGKHEQALFIIEW